MKYSLINCYSDYNKGDLGIILTTVQYLREIDKNSIIRGISTYNYSDPFYHSQHRLLSKTIPVYPSLFGELNIGKHKDPVSKIIRYVYDCFRFAIMLAFRSSFLLTKKEKETFSILKESDYIISKGGSFLCDEKNYRVKLSLRRFLMIFNLIFTLLPKARLVILCQSLGPVYDKGTQRKLNEVLKKCYKVVLREDCCLREYPYISIPDDKLLIRNDIAFHLNPIKIPLPFEESKTLKIGMTIRSVSPKLKPQYQKMMKSCIEHVVSKYKAEVYIFPHVTVDDDVDESFNIFRMIGDRFKSNVTIFTDNYQSGELKYLYSKMDFFVATRLHSAIFATGEGVPSIVIAYHGTKAQGVFNNLNLSDWVVTDYNTNLSDLFDNLVSNFDKEKLKVTIQEDKIQTLDCISSIF